uniref:Uncharacterized protein n=1 Tax=Amorphochlora amoebiformis TaxID=1561963 RepID=A0A0H5BR14_9EUKA|nr:hypothetical protein [Amorphochlora amoebiformis]
MKLSFSLYNSIKLLIIKYFNKMIKFEDQFRVSHQLELLMNIDYFYENSIFHYYLIIKYPKILLPKV